MKRSKVEFSSHTANLALLRKCVRDFLKGYPFSEKERMMMVLGVDEACTNVIRYAYRLRDDRLISLRMEGLRANACACGCAITAKKFFRTK
jgi:anti-sigma regulatory factor (Ser/Thr protein kinase)